MADQSAEIKEVSDGKFVLSGNLNYETVPLLWKTSQELFASKNSLSIDLTGVQQSNSAALALLLEWMKLIDSNGNSIEFLNLPEQLREIAQLCGLDQKLPG